MTSPAPIETPASPDTVPGPPRWLVMLPIGLVALAFLGIGVLTALHGVR